MLPEAAMEYMSTRLLPPNELSVDEKNLLTKWITKGKQKIDHSDVIKSILIMMSPNNIQYINNPDEEECLRVVYEEPSLIKHIKDPSEILQLAAIGTGKLPAGMIFNMIENPAMSVWEKVIEETPGTIKTTVDPAINLQLIAIKQLPSLITSPLKGENGWADEAKCLAFQMDNSLFPYVDNPSIDDCWTALRHDSSFISHIKDPLDEMKAFAILVA